MQLFPSIDLRSGKCVRLYQGSYQHMTVYDEDPIKTALSFKKQGATQLHIVDLDGAKAGKPMQYELIADIKKQTGLVIQAGGGIREEQHIDTLLQSIDRVVIGSIAVLNIARVKQWLKKFGNEKIVLALDVRFNEKQQPQLAAQAWQQATQKNLWQLLMEYEEVKYVLCTDIQRDGTLHGPNIALYQECVKRFPSIAFQASGGVSDLSDLQKLADIPMFAVIIGKALYENKFPLADALNEVAVC